MSDIIDNKAHHRFELVVEGHLAAAYYKVEGNVITFILSARSIRSAPPA